MPDDNHPMDRTPKPRFDSTQWSLIMAAQHRSSPEGRLAFETLCEKYWYPLYAYVRQSERDVHRARDLTQAFFQKVIEKNYIADADPKRGRFRTFLLASLSHFIANEWNKSQAAKRGGGRKHFSLEFDQGDRLLRQEPVTEQTAEVLYERRWAMTLLSQVLKRLRDEYVAANKASLFSTLKQFLVPGESESYSTVGERLNMSEGAVRVAVHRLRAQYREILRDEIADTIASRADVDDEIRSLFETFAS